MCFGSIMPALVVSVNTRIYDCNVVSAVLINFPTVDLYRQ
jgi:hypothetical protein